jgi:hypothetical protein
VHRDFANSRLRASAKSSEPPARLPIGVRRNTYITNRFQASMQKRNRICHLASAILLSTAK